MESKGRKRLSNVIMVILILIIFTSGIITVGMFQGWFGSSDESLIKSGRMKGVVNIERKGVGYTLKQDVSMISGDSVETKKGAEAELILADKGTVVMNGNTEVTLGIDKENAVQLEVLKGEIYGGTMEYRDAFEVIFGENKAQLSEAVFSVSAQQGSQMLNVYAGDISLVLADGTRERVEAGECLMVVQEKDGNIDYTIYDIPVASLNQFQITQCQNTLQTTELCFKGEELQGVLDQRAAEKQAALEVSLKGEAQIPAQTESEDETEESEAVSETEAGTEESEAVSETETGTEAVTEAETEKDSGEQQEIVEEYVTEYDTNICTITIRCDTILDNMNNLDHGKEAYVPANGCILDTSRVEFAEGETVFDVLKRVCEYAGIQLEYSWTPIYNSYYIEGINNLYEFDCGNESGWMYKVNGWFPNYGCSSYELSDGDTIVWCYTCNGLGADVGGSIGGNNR